jgi:hypothetical protein
MLRKLIQHISEHRRVQQVQDEVLLLAHGVVDRRGDAERAGGEAEADLVGDVVLALGLRGLGRGVALLREAGS